MYKPSSVGIQVEKLKNKMQAAEPDIERCWVCPGYVCLFMSLFILHCLPGQLGLFAPGRPTRHDENMAASKLSSANLDTVEGKIDGPRMGHRCPKSSEQWTSKCVLVNSSSNSINQELMRNDSSPSPTESEMLAMRPAPQSVFSKALLGH